VQQRSTDQGKRDEQDRDKPYTHPPPPDNSYALTYGYGRKTQHSPQPAAGGRLIAGARLDYGRNRGSIAVSQITPATAAFVAEQST